jgi:hypothetical protein
MLRSLCIIFLLFCLYALNNCGSPNPTQEKTQAASPITRSDSLPKEKEEGQEIEQTLNELEKENDTLDDIDEGFSPE